VETPSDAGFAGSELTLTVSQAIELGGKRTRRIALANRQSDAALWDYEVARSSIVSSVRQAFVDALAAQESVSLRRRLVELAAETLSAAVVRVEAGKDSPTVLDRAEVEHAQARIALAAAERRLVATRYALAAHWDDRKPAFDAIDGDLFAVDSPPDLDTLSGALEQSPELARWTAEVALREAEVSLARAHRVPDLTVSVGWRGTGLADGDARVFDAAGTLTGVSRTRPDEDWDHSLVFGFSIPLPLYSRNRGNVIEAEHLAAKASHDRRAAHAAAWAGITEIHAAVEAAHAAVSELRGAVLPAADRAYEAAEAGFESGKFPYIESLDAQRTLVEVQTQFIDALAAYHRGVAELERVIGARIAAGPAGHERTGR
jgi:cobalt-zinc-cadmium efflux system outer membrane protein